MSAIAGLWRFDGKPGLADDCARMLGALQVYGPHDSAQWSGGPIAMGRRLFRTLPEDTYDRQPLQSRDGRLTLVADLRLDNRDDLIPALNLTQADASRLCDAAVLLASLERWGEAALDRIVGDFAFALWDEHVQTLLLARDCMGQRPLHYHQGKGFFAFATMAKGLHALPEVPYGPDEQMMAEFLVLLPRRGSRSFFKDIERVEPGHAVTVTRGGVSSRRYWQPTRPDAALQSRRDYAEGLRHHVDLATQSRLRGLSKSIGSHLSAGYDSSIVTATAARLLAPGGGKIAAFTAVPREGYAGPERKNRIGNEGPLAATTAAMYPNIEHVLIRSNASPLASFERMFHLYECPALNVMNMGWGHAINRAARDRNLSIMLTGMLGNMTVSYYGIERLPELLRAGRPIALWQEMAKLVAKGTMRWRGAALWTFGAYLPGALWQWLHETFGDGKIDVRDYSAIRQKLLADPEFAAAIKERSVDFAHRPWTDGFAYRLWFAQRANSANYNKGALASWGIDLRHPVADKRLVEYCLSVPTSEFLADGELRTIAKRAFADRLPSSVLNAKKKGIQAIDWHEHLTAAQSEVAVELDRLQACAPAANVLDLKRMKTLLDNWPKADWRRTRVRYAYRLALLRGLSAGHFLRKASGGNQ